MSHFEKLGGKNDALNCETNKQWGIKSENFKYPELRIMSNYKKKRNKYIFQSK